MSASALKALQIRAELKSLGLDPRIPHTQKAIDEARKPKPVAWTTMWQLPPKEEVALPISDVILPVVVQEVVLPPEVVIAIVTGPESVQDITVTAPVVAPVLSKKDKKTKAKAEVETKVKSIIEVAPIETVVPVEESIDEESAIS